MSNNAFSFGGTDLGAYGLSVQSGVFPGFADPKFNTTEFSQAHGGAIKGSYLKTRHITIPVAVVAADFATLRTNLESIKQILAPSQGEQDIIFDYDATRKFTGRLSGGFEVPLIATRAITTNLVFLCSDPLAYAVSSTSVENTDGTETINYAGSALAPIVVIGDPDGATIGSELSVENTTSGEKVACDYPLGAQWIKFDGEREVIEISADDGSNWTNINSYLSSTDYFFPKLEVGNNNLVFTGFTNSGPSAYTWTTTYTARYF